MEIYVDWPARFVVMGRKFAARTLPVLFYTVLLVLFLVATVPDAVLRRMFTVAPTSQMRWLLVGATLVVIGALGWHLSFGNRAYYRPKYLRHLVQSIFLTPVLFGLVVFALFAYVPQMREIYLSIIEQSYESGRPDLRAVSGFLALLLLCALLNCWQQQISAGTLTRLYPDHGDLTFDRGLGRVQGFKVLLSGTLPWLGILVGIVVLLFEAAEQHGRLLAVAAAFEGAPNRLLDDSTQRLLVAGLVRNWTAIVMAALAAAGLALLIALLLRRLVSAQNFRAAVITLAVIVTFAQLVLPPVFRETTVEVARSLGPLCMVSAVLTAFATVLFGVSQLSLRWRMPMTGIALLMLVSYLAIKLVFDSPAPSAETKRRDVAASWDKEALHRDFTQWLEARPDRELFQRAGRKYPVFLVAVSGGGIYATSAAASFLVSLQQACPAFAQHVFAISGVSGGALGAAVFNGLTQDAAPIRQWCSRLSGMGLGTRTSGIVRADHLSPVVSIIFSDLVRNLLLPSFGSFDAEVTSGRSRAGCQDDQPAASIWRRIWQSLHEADRADMLQLSFSVAFEQGVGRRAATGQGIAGPWVGEQAAASQAQKPCPGSPKATGLDIPFSGHWRADGVAPAMLLNTTWSETGFRIAFSPFPLRAHSDGTLFSFSELLEGSVPARTLIEAAAVSARFPGIVPAWRINPKPSDALSRRWNFVDGGYVDNSGSTTAVEIFQQLDDYLPSKGTEGGKARRTPPGGLEIDLRLILLTDAEPDRKFDGINGTNFSDTLAPLNTLLNVRSQLSSRAIARTIDKIEPGTDRRALTAQARPGEQDSRIWLVNLEHAAFPLPLGWTISGVTNELIGHMLGRPDLCIEVPSNRMPREATTPSKEEEVRAARAAIQAIVENSCVKDRILKMLQPGP